MKAREVMEILRSTLRHLRKRGVLKVDKLPNGHYDFDPESVYKYLLEKKWEITGEKNCYLCKSINSKTETGFS
jgi:predicted site-specific integrase-resolvase